MTGKRREPGETRGKLLALLCSADRTTGDLARVLNISANGVRDQLDRLVEEGLVERRVVRQGVGKPAHEYHLTDQGSVRLSRAYLPVLSGLLFVMGSRHGAEVEEGYLREVGRVLALQQRKPDGGIRERLAAAAGSLEALGGICIVREEKQKFWIDGTCCPLRALVPQHPLVCKAMESMLEEYVGVPVREECDRGDPPSCRLGFDLVEARR